LFEARKKQYKDDEVMATCFNAGWSKLNKWYTSTDDSPVYKAAVVLYPGFKWEYVEKV
jgi:hypothetical protein